MPQARVDGSLGAPDVTLAQARQQMTAIAARIAHDYPRSHKGWSVTIGWYQDRFVNDNLRRSLLVLLAAVGTVLLIGCVNLANLLLVRGAGYCLQTAPNCVNRDGTMRNRARVPGNVQEVLILPGTRSNSPS